MYRAYHSLEQELSVSELPLHSELHLEGSCGREEWAGHETAMGENEDSCNWTTIKIIKGN